MSEPEPSPAIRRLFEELEAEFEASLRREARSGCRDTALGGLGSAGWQRGCRTGWPSVVPRHAGRQLPGLLRRQGRGDPRPVPGSPGSGGLGEPPGRAAGPPPAPVSAPVPLHSCPTRACPSSGASPTGARRWQRDGGNDRGRRERPSRNRRAPPGGGSSSDGAHRKAPPGPGSGRGGHASSGLPVSGCAIAHWRVFSCIRSM